VLWRGLAETAEKYVHKGDKLYIEGKIRTRSYDDQNGVKRYTTEIQVDTMEMLTPRGNGAQQPNAQPTPQYIQPQQPAAQPAPQQLASSPADDLPF
jgi:single-strand DNA-binding protein